MASERLQQTQCGQVLFETLKLFSCDVVNIITGYALEPRFAFTFETHGRSGFIACDDDETIAVSCTKEVLLFSKENGSWIAGLIVVDNVDIADSVGYPQGVCFDSQGNIIVSTSTGRIVVFRKDNPCMKNRKDKKKHTYQRHISPYHYAGGGGPIALCSDDTVYVVQQFGGRKILCQEVNSGRVLHSFDQPAHRIAGGMLLDKSNQHILLSYMQDICTLDLSGRLVSHKRNSDFLSTPYGIAFDIRGVLWACDPSVDRVSFFDESGDFRCEPGLCLTSANGHLFSSPQGICFDKDNNMFVIDVNNQRVCVFRL